MSTFSYSVAFWCGACGFAGGWFGDLFSGSGKGSHALPQVVIKQSSEDCSQEIVVTGGAAEGFPWLTFWCCACVFFGGGLYAGCLSGKFWYRQPVVRTYVEPDIIDELEDVQLSRRRPGFGSLPVTRDLAILDAGRSDTARSVTAEPVWRPRGRK